MAGSRQVRRNYSRSLFRQRRSRFSEMRTIFALGLLIGAVLVFVVLQFDRLQLTALDAVGMAPTATPFASERASLGLQLYQSGDLEGAVIQLEQAVAQRPDDINYLYEYGRVLLESDRFDEALTIADRAMAVAPDDPRGYALRARALMWTDPPAAIQAALSGIDADPDFAPLHAASSVAYYNLGRWQESLREGQRAIALDPSDPFVQRAYYPVLQYTGRYQEAIEVLENAIALNPNLTPAYFELAAMYKSSQVNQPEMAIAVYNRILEIEPENARAYLRLCETYAGVEFAQFDVAQVYCDRAKEIDPEYGSAYRELGRMQYAQRNYEGSIESFEECARLGAEDIECYYLRGLAHYALGQCQQAWDVLVDSRQRAADQGYGEKISGLIERGLGFVRQDCLDYANQPLPTSPPPTSIPPTPIGGGFG